MIPIATGPAGTIGGASARGASHIRRNKPNQDAGASQHVGAWSIMAVSDGHGGEAYVRSDRGSRMAVRAAIDTVGLVTAGGAAGVGDLDRLQAEMATLPSRVVAAWRAAVDADLAADPSAALGKTPRLAYGATCLVAALGPGISFFAQIGDGDILAAAAHRDLVKPLPDDENIVGEQTYSLCQDDAVLHFRVALFAAPHPLSSPQFAMASSDGLAKSFADDAQFFDVARQWRRLVESRGIDAVCAELEPWLARCSEMGSGDDTTLLLFADNGAAAGRPMPEIAIAEPAAPSGRVGGTAAARPPGRRPASAGWLPLLVAAAIGALAGGSAVYATLTAGGPRAAPAPRLVAPAPIAVPGLQARPADPAPKPASAPEPAVSTPAASPLPALPGSDARPQAAPDQQPPPRATDPTSGATPSDSQSSPTRPP